MVKSHASGIYGTRIRPASNELGDSVRGIEFRCIWSGQRKGGYYWEKAARSWCPPRCAASRVTSHAKIGYGGSRGRLRLYQPQSFIRDKKEGSVLSVIPAWNLDRSAKSTTEIVLPKSAFFQSGIENPEVVGEVVRGVENVIPQIFRGGAVELIRSRFCFEGELAAGIAPVFGRICRTLYAKLLKIIYRDQGLSGA